MVTAANLPLGKCQFLDGDGNPLAGGQVFFYIPTTTTFKDTWSDPNQGFLNTNPVDLDSSGEAIIFGNGLYRQLVKDAFGNTVWDELVLGVIELSAASQISFDGNPIGFSATNVQDAIEEASAQTVNLVSLLSAEVAHLDQVNVFLASGQTLQWNDAGAAAGPTLLFDRNSASPLASDLLGNIPFFGNDNSGADQLYAELQSYIVNPTAGSERGGFAVRTARLGTVANRLMVESGVYLGAASGGDQGAGSINAESYFQNGVALASGGTAIAPVNFALQSVVLPIAQATSKRITLTINGMSYNNSAACGSGIRLGTSGGLQSSGYNGVIATNQQTTYFPMTTTVLSGTNYFGVFVLTLANPTSNIWMINGQLMIDDGSPTIEDLVGTVTLSGVLTQIQFGVFTGSPNWDAGFVSGLVE